MGAPTVWTGGHGPASESQDACDAAAAHGMPHRQCGRWPGNIYVYLAAMATKSDDGLTSPRQEGLLCSGFPFW